MSIINISGLSKAKVLAALYNGSRAQGFGFIHYKNGEMTEAYAEQILKDSQRFDYLHGRVMKVDLRGDSFDSSLYDRDNGEDAAKVAIDAIRPNMKRVSITVCSDPTTIGPDASDRELFAYANNLAKLLEREFNCTIRIHLGSEERTVCDDPLVSQRIRAIETSDEWRKLLP